MACAAIAMASSEQREERPHLEGDLVGGHGDRPDARRHRRRGGEGGEQRAGAHHDLAADAGRGADPRGIRTQWCVEPVHRAQHDHEVGDRRAVLGEDRSPRRAGETEPEPVDEDELDAEVRDVGRHRDHQRRGRVLASSLVARAGERDQHRGRADEADPQVRQRERSHRI